MSQRVLESLGFHQRCNYGRVKRPHRMVAGRVAPPRLELANEDLVGGTLRASRCKQPLNGIVCFYSRQCAEMNLKAMLQQVGLTVPRTNDPANLSEELLPRFAALRSLLWGMRSLGKYDLNALYPGSHPSKREAASALNWAGKVRVIVGKLLV